MKPAKPSRPAGRWLVGTLVVVAVTAAACSGDDDLDRRAAVDDVIEASPDPIEREQAECYVDRVADELGVSALNRDTNPPPEQVRRLAAIRVDCVGAANLGISEPGEPPLLLEDGDPVPWDYGDDTELDAWWEACGGGDPVACDRLFEQAPLGSVYEWFGATCGDTQPRELCSDPESPPEPDVAEPDVPAPDVAEPGQAD